MLTRTSVIEVRELITVAEISTTARGSGAEVPIDHLAVGLDRESVVNCDGLHTVRQSTLERRVGALDDTTLERVCEATRHALDC